MPARNRQVRQLRRACGGGRADGAPVRRLRSTGACATTAALLGLLALLGGVIPAHAEGRVGSATLLLQVRPEELLQVGNGSVALKIRLAPGVTAQLWAANACSAPAADSQVIAASGSYSIPFSSLAVSGSAPSSGALKVCLASTDGGLNDSVPVTLPAPGAASAAPAPSTVNASGPASADVAEGWAVTLHAGVTTWSEP